MGTWHSLLLGTEVSEALHWAPFWTESSTVAPGAKADWKVKWTLPDVGEVTSEYSEIV